MCSRLLQWMPQGGRALNRLYSSPVVTVPNITNEPILNFAPGSKERNDVIKALEELRTEVEEIPCVIGGQKIFTGDIKKQVSPYDHQRVVAHYHHASKEHIQLAIDAAMAARKEWERTPFEHRAGIFLRMADLLATKYRPMVIATTMVGQGKTVLQAEIDAACEVIDFFRFAVLYAAEMYGDQPKHHSPNTWNRIEYRGMEGFVAAVTPFNFTAIGTNLSMTPTLMGNVSVWKPSNTAILSNYFVFKVFQEAGMPDGVCNFVPTTGPNFGDTITASPHLAAVSFTGGTDTFTHLWKQVADNVGVYRTFPRLVGECGGKNYHLIHPSAKEDTDSIAYCSVRSAFEYSGQKCSACSRMYVPESLWPEIRDKMVAVVKEMHVLSAEDFRSFTSAVIDAKSFKNIKGYLDFAHSSSDCNVLVGGNADDSVGYFVEPTIVQVTDPKNKLMEEEIFGPVLTVYVYPDKDTDAVLDLVDNTSPYGLTGSIFSRDRAYVEKVMRELRQSAGNFYINDKSTGSVVGQQPFGGARLSGTNDKAGAPQFVQRWTSPQSIKETTVPYADWSYPSVDK
ncbi:delta-1-pyrroline-5-carboxylate dehydrogenase, mitochondrial-like [Halichondria panicea]|uniref:delta-1-pyrroline-5-carboxylate dehydrogenase, mitochondrial-like n=1 Tax=Halichondria panicea TaxID=6063 RepID=UPI00312B75A2